MTSVFTRVNVEMRYAEPARTPPYGRWPADACPLPATAIEARRLVIWQRKTRTVVQMYDAQNPDVRTTEQGIKVRVSDHYREMWIDWAYYMPITGDVLEWEYLNRSTGRFEVIGVCT